MKNLKQHINERVKATPKTRAKLAKPLDKKTISAFNLKVKNMADDLDSMAWDLENRIELKNNPAPHYPRTEFLTHAIDITLDRIKKLQKIFKNDLK
jgi:hypothetical protein